MPNITLEDDDSGAFILTCQTLDGATQSMRLTEEDVLKMGQSSQHLMTQILAQRSRPGAIAAALTPVVQLELNTDLHKTEVHLTMIDRNGVRVGYSLPVDVVRPLAERLPLRLAEIEAASKARTRQ